MLCAGNTHVYRVGSLTCDCGAQANNPPIGYGYPPNYNPHHPRYRPATPVGVCPPVAEPEIPESVKAKAIETGASHISSDGKTGYRLRMGKVEHIHFDSLYPTWWGSDDEVMPCGVIDVQTSHNPES